MDFIMVEERLGDDWYNDVIINVNQITQMNPRSNLIYLSDGRKFNISDKSTGELLRYITCNGKDR